MGSSADLLGHPQVDLRDGKLTERGREEVRGEDVFGFRVEVGIRFGPGVPGADGEVLGELVRPSLRP